MSEDRLYLIFGVKDGDPLQMRSETKEFCTCPYITNNQVKVIELLKKYSGRAFLFPEMQEIKEVDIILK